LRIKEVPQNTIFTIVSVALAVSEPVAQGRETFRVNGGYALNCFQLIDSNSRRFLVQDNLNQRDHRQFERDEPYGEPLRRYRARIRDYSA
jgi:hypothetical protein